MSAPALDQAMLHRILHYDPETGSFTWRVRPAELFATKRACSIWNVRYAERTAGYRWAPGPNVTYRCIRIFDWPFLAHRLAWLYVTGAWPIALVDHRDLDGENNRWSNLREADKSQNGANTGAPRTNKTGFKGVSRLKARFRANIKIDGRQCWLGSFVTAEEAHAAYCAAAKQRSGEFARGA